MSRHSLRDQLLDSGVQTIHRHGYGAASVRDITTAADVPLGTFSNHFSSKEQFALAALDRYVERLAPRTEATLGNPALPARERLERYFDVIEDAFQAAGWRFGCMIPNMAVEMPEQSDVIRARLIEILDEQRSHFAAALKEFPTIRIGTSDVAEQDVAGVLQAAWHGTLMQMKVVRDAEPIRRFRRVVSAALG